MTIIWQGKNEVYEKAGIYGIYLNDKLIYIGSTQRSFKQRLKEHNYKLNNHDSGYLYTYLNKYSNIKTKLSLRSLLVFDYIRTTKEISQTEVGWIELSCISMFRPICNLAGVKTNFVFPRDEG